MLDAILSTIAPHRCLGCGRINSLLCQDCRNKLPRVAERCYRCHKFSEGSVTCKPCRKVSRLNSVRCTTYHDGVAKQLIWKLKFYNARSAAKEMAELMSSLLRADSSGVIIAHVPTATSRVRQRGYDQSRLVAKYLAKHRNLKYIPALRRLGQHQQVGASRSQRIKQLRNAFKAATPAVAGRHIILVDDVMTTGATLEAAAAELKRAGAKKVEAVVFARA